MHEKKAKVLKKFSITTFSIFVLLFTNIELHTSSFSNSREGQISGTVINRSGQDGFPIFVLCWNKNVQRVVSVDQSSNTYTIDNLPDGDYILAAIVDSEQPPLERTGFKPQQGEAWGLYQGTVQISSYSRVAGNVDIVIGPLPTGGIKGVVSYTGAQQGRGNLVVEATALSLFTNFPSYGWGHVVIPAGAQFPVEYTINYLANDPNYSVRAYIDLNGNLELRL